MTLSPGRHAARTPGASVALTPNTIHGGHPRFAARAATKTIPIVFSTIGDPVQLGLVASLRRPGGNITGATYLNVEVGPKLLELLHEVVPTATTVAALVNPTNPNAEILTVCRSLLARSGSNSTS